MELPSTVVYCKRCVMSNQRPSSRPEHLNKPGDVPPTMHIDEEGVCDACRQAERKEQIDWNHRRQQLERLCDQYRRNDGRFDCVVPGSGGKDSVMAAWVLKNEFGMHPLTCTWPPFMYTDYGRRNFDRWCHYFHNVTVKPSAEVHAYLTKLAIENLLHPFQPFIIGQKNLAPKIALQYDVPLVFYGENEAEYGNPLADNESSRRKSSFYSLDMHANSLHLGGVSVYELQTKHGLCLSDLNFYLPASKKELDAADVQVHYLGYYLKWTPQEAYYYAVEKTGFEPRPFRTDGTFSKYNSIDDKIDDLHYHTTYAKFGLGRATYDASQEIRNGHRTREEGVELVKKYDGETPSRYLKQVLDAVGITEERYWELWSAAKPAHLFGPDGNLLHPVWEET